MSDVMRKNYRPLSGDEVNAMMAIKGHGERFLEALNANADLFDTRCYAIARTKIEEAVMWAVKGVTG